MKTVYKRPRLLKEAHFHYCPGCGHGIINRLLMEVIEEMGLEEEAVCVAPAGCGMLLYNYFEIDVIESAHGRGSAVATGIKRVAPESLVFSYQGDGDLAAIGTAEGFHAANRGENITVIFVNNGVYGMTGGQMAPTTLHGQVTTTTPGGRDSLLAGHPVRICEVFAMLDGATYLERVAVNKPAGVRRTKKAIAKAFRHQLEGCGFSLVEILAPCPTNWKMGSIESCRWIDEVMCKQFPLGLIKDESCT
jgi:2-oxoglutarate ferredoxin oxidoreductase subunit beta